MRRGNGVPARGPQRDFRRAGFRAGCLQSDVCERVGLGQAARRMGFRRLDYGAQQLVYGPAGLGYEDSRNVMVWQG